MVEIDNVEQVEQCAQQVVNVIEQLIETIRSVKEFAPMQNKGSIEGVMLFSEMNSCGILDKVKKAQELIESVLPDANVPCLYTSQTDADKQDERTQLVQHVLLPLVSMLTKCYKVLDQVPSPIPDVASANKRNKKNKPPPPRGMLSIKNYTDVAALLELFVCTSILPNLQHHVLASVEERSRYHLPKSLAGRIPRRSLQWGCAVARSKDFDSVPRVVQELQHVALVLGSLVLLDRFRPMLLPRHLVDIYAAMFQAEALQQTWNEKHPSRPIEESPKEYHLLQHLLLVSPNNKSQSSFRQCVDLYSHARACQALLFQGTKSPLWLRQRVSKLLTQMACRDLATIVQVFVQQGSTTKDMTGASLRLAQALAGRPATQYAYYEALCLQLVQLLDAVPREQDMDSHAHAGILTVWAVFHQLPLDVMLTHVLPLFGNGIIFPACNDEESTKLSRDDYSIHRTVLRIRNLFSVPTPWRTCSKVYQLLLRPIQIGTNAKDCKEGIPKSLLGQLLRLASLQTTLYSAIKEDACLCLRLVVMAMSETSFKSSTVPNSTSMRGVDLVAHALLYSVAPNAWDVNGYCYKLLPDLDKKSDLELVRVDKLADDSQDVAVIAEQVMKRAEVVLDDIIIPFSKPAEELEDANMGENESKSDEPVNALPSTLFNLLLLVYFSTSASTRQDPKGTRSRVYSLFERHKSHFAITAMTLLPVTCEKFSPQSLLLGDGNEVLGLIKTIMDCAGAVFGSQKDSLEVGGSCTGSEVEQSPQGVPLDAAISSIGNDGILSELFGLEMDEREEAHHECDDSLVLPSGDETLMSISSLVLGILIAILELGNTKRAEMDERVLTQMVPSLQSIARNASIALRGNLSSTVEHSDLVEMASHALALIASRSASPSPREPVRIQKRKSVREKIDQAEKDLRSGQAPIRARGVVSLRHVARGFPGQINEPAGGKLVEVIGEETQRTDNETVLKDILRLGILALDDSESYVFLAAIQAIVAAADARPKIVLPLLGKFVCSGVVTSSETDLQLTPAQRVKLTEAISFALRRRGSAVDDYAPYLMDLMIFGQAKRDDSISEEAHVDTGFRIQSDTHEYFAGRREDGDPLWDSQLESVERQLRLRTGGPVFREEENDLLRAGCVSILAELVARCRPSLSAERSQYLVDLATNALKLDVSRPVRRSASVLCRELYDAVLRELDDAVGMSLNGTNEILGMSLAIELVSSGEEGMHAALQRCVQADDVNDTISQRASDPATISRCEEALELRTMLHNEGVFTAAKTIVSSRELSKKQRTTNLLQDLLRQDN